VSAASGIHSIYIIIAPLSVLCVECSLFNLMYRIAFCYYLSLSGFIVCCECFLWENVFTGSRCCISYIYGFYPRPFPWNGLGIAMAHVCLSVCLSVRLSLREVHCVVFHKNFTYIVGFFRIVGLTPQCSLNLCVGMCFVGLSFSFQFLKNNPILVLSRTSQGLSNPSQTKFRQLPDILWIWRHHVLDRWKHIF
jgi:hypothetical protein